MHNHGIGSAMVAYASEILRDAGTRVCHIGWAVRDRFYGRVGYRPWRRYRMFHSHGRSSSP
jgi:predicted N-acetyltransferase YhbS